MMINKLALFMGFLRRLSCILPAVTMVSPGGWAASPLFEQGRTAYQQGDIASAIELWHPLATEGDADAQFALGTLYYSGVGVPKNHTESSYWFHLAAEQDHAAAQYNLGNAYKRGEGVRRNDKMAVRWWQKAAQLGFAAAQFNLASAYRDGAGIGKDPDQALVLYRLAAKNGYQPALDLLADLEETDTGAAEQTSCNAWLDKHAAMSYTLQLISTSQQGGAERFAQQHELQEHTVCRYQVNGQTTYALLLGAYPDTAAAQQAEEALPAALRANKPWIRKLSAVRQLVR